MKLLQLITCTLHALLPFNSRNAQAQEALPRIALSSNLLSWATLAPNIGVEVYIGKKLSIAADGSYGMWNYSHTHSSMQTWSVGGEARYWLQTRQYGFRRTYIGLSVRGGEYHHYNCSDGHRGEALLAGLIAGYRFTLPGNWFFDAGLGLGYIHTRYDRYFRNKRFKTYEFNGERTRNVFGLTNLHASVIYRFPTKKR